MKLRFRLFLYVTSIFGSTLFFSFIFQEYLIKKNLSKDESVFAEEFKIVNEEKISRIEKYIVDVLKGYKEEINALLSIIKKLPILSYHFIPDETSVQKKTWLDSSTLITNNKWIDLVENIKDDKLSSSIIVKNQVLDLVNIYPITEHLYFFYPEDNLSLEPLVAVFWKNPNFYQQQQSVGANETPQTDIADFYVLFSKQTILDLDVEKLSTKNLKLSIDPLYPFLKWIEVSEQSTLFDGLLEELKLAQQDLKDFTNLPNFQKKMPKVNLIDPAIDRYHQIGMIWGLATLIASGPFGEDPYDERAPYGVIRTQTKGGHQGELLKSLEVFSKEDFLKKGRSTQESEDLKVIFMKDENRRSFFGNTVYFQNKQNQSQLTVGVDSSKVIQQLALATNRAILFMSGNEMISYCNKNGEFEQIEPLSNQTLDEMQKQTLGSFESNGTRYFFLHIVPFNQEQMHFFAITTYAHEFGLIEKETAQIKKALKTINFQLLLVILFSFALLLILLDFIALKISRPISTLALAALAVKQGKYDEAYEPTKKTLKGDEVEALYDSFYDMVKGLKEKERVRGVLNKVVSADVADEILKKDLNLGGEEKEVTMFFADIRGFTNLSEKMQPHEVIEMLNEVMTLVSKPIEAHHGVIDKYVGDEVMALFGAPLDLIDHEFEAVMAALEFRDLLNKYNQNREKEKKPPIFMGIGIHEGKILAGNMGAINRLNYTVIGANVNMASRLCACAKGGEILISSNVLKNPKITRCLEVKELEPLLLKGFSEKIQVYSVIGLKQPLV